MIRSTVWLEDGEVLSFDIPELSDAIAFVTHEYSHAKRMDFDRIDDEQKGGDS